MVVVGLLLEPPCSSCALGRDTLIYHAFYYFELQKEVDKALIIFLLPGPYISMYIC